MAAVPVESHENLKSAVPSRPYTYQNYWMNHSKALDPEGHMVVHDGMRIWYPGIGRKPTNPELLQFAQPDDMTIVASPHMPGEHGGRRRKKTRKTRRSRRSRKTRKHKKTRRH